METKELKLKSTQELKDIKANNVKKLDVLSKAGFEADPSISAMNTAIDEILSKRTDEILTEQLNEALAMFKGGKNLDTAKLLELLTTDGKTVNLTFNAEQGKLVAQVIVKKSSGGGGGVSGGVKTENPFKGHVSFNGQPAPANWSVLYTEVYKYLVANGMPAIEVPEKTSMFLEFKKLVKKNPSVEPLIKVELDGKTIQDVYTWKGATA